MKTLIILSLMLSLNSFAETEDVQCLNSMMTQLNMRPDQGQFSKEFNFKGNNCEVSMSFHIDHDGNMNGYDASIDTDGNYNTYDFSINSSLHKTKLKSCTLNNSKIVVEFDTKQLYGWKKSFHNRIEIDLENGQPTRVRGTEFSTFSSQSLTCDGLK